MSERWFSLHTPLGQDVLIPTGVTGYEAVSSLFWFEITAVAKRSSDVSAKELVGKEITLQISRTGCEDRSIHGLVVALSSGAVTQTDYRLYQLTIAPKVWILGRQSDYRVFQELTVEQILAQELKAADVAFKLALKSRPKRDYCVQYGETHLAFLLRLMAEEGMLFFFEHVLGKHTLVVTDDPKHYAKCADAQVYYRPGSSDSGICVNTIDRQISLTDSSWAVHDFNFESPDHLPKGTDKTKDDPAAQKGWSHHVYGVTSPDEQGLSNATMTRLARARVLASEAGYEVVRSESGCPTFVPGHKFELREHVDGDAEYVVTEIRHEGRDDAYTASNPDPPSYQNTVSCIPADRLALRDVPNRKPFVPGPHTATVVGPAGEEIHTDKYGRIRIQFHWDMHGKNNEKSSCFVRVAQSWSGKGWGALFTPRVGMEVVVHFLDGDPDRPLVTGSVYNGDDAPPWSLPDKKEISGWMTRSTPQGAAENANWLYFLDTKGSEQVNVQAEKDFVRVVKHDDTLEVRHDQTRKIKNDRTTTVEDGHDALTLTKGARTVTLDKGDHTLKLSAGSQFTTLTEGDQKTVLEGGNQTTTLQAGNLTTTLTEGDLKMACDAGQLTLEAMKKITVVCGPSKIELTPEGIKIEGVTVSAAGEAKAEVKAPIVNVTGDGMANIKAALVKIN